MDEDERQAEDEGTDDALVARDIFVLAFLAQKAGKHTLARAAWQKYVTIRFVGGKTSVVCSTYLLFRGLDFY